MSRNVNLSVIIATYRRYEKLIACLQSLNVSTLRDGRLFEVIVVDDGGNLNRDLESRITGLNAQWVYLPQNLGQPAAQAWGAARSRGETLAFLDDDAVVSSDWITTIVDYFAKNRDIGAVLGRIEPTDTSHVLPRMRQQIYDRRHRLYMDETFVKSLKDRYGLEVETHTALSDHVSGGNFAIRKAVYESIGGFAVDVRMGSDDLISKKLLEAGCAIGYNDKMVIYHDHNKSFKTLFRNNFSEGRDRVRILNLDNVNKARLFWKIFTNLLLVPFKIKSFPEMLAADRFRVKVYLIYTTIQFIDAAGQVYQFMADSFNMKSGDKRQADC